MFANEEVREVGDMARYHTTVDLPVEVFEDEEKIIETSYKPLGVCAAICPWNFPIFLAMGKIAPAVMAGNTIIVKPS